MDRQQGKADPASLAGVPAESEAVSGTVRRGRRAAARDAAADQQD